MRALLVDNDPLSLELSQTFLETFYNIESDVVNSAGEALYKLNKELYDVVVSDYEMPLMDGITFLRVIRDKGISIPFILFTITGKEEIMSQAIANGASSVIQKTGDPKTQYYQLSRQIWQITDNKKK